VDLESCLEAIDAALDEGDIDAALRLAGQAKREFPGDPDVRVAYAHALWDAEDLRGARAAYQEAMRLAPQSSEIRGYLAWSHLALAEFAEAETAARQANELEENPDALAVLSHLAERGGKIDEADRLARRAHDLEPDDFPVPYRVSEAEFRNVVAESLDALPDEFRKALDGQVAILVQPVPTLELLEEEDPPLDPQLLGLYVGTPLPEREASTTKLPDVIYLFQRNLEHECSDRQELLEEIATTVYHEVGHYFGFDDDELDDLDFG
jgi:predicted Zn-dependent protease with MMP-like domain